MDMTLLTEEQEDIVGTFLENIFEYGKDSILSHDDINRNDNERLIIFHTYCDLKKIDGTPGMDYIKEFMAHEDMQDVFAEFEISFDTVKNIMEDGKKIQERMNLPDMEPEEALQYMFEQRGKGSSHRSYNLPIQDQHSAPRH
jgi:hypothetical protein